MYAHWTPVSYTITYNGAEVFEHNNPASYTVEDAEISLTAAQRTGYIFAGWYTAETDGEQVTAIQTSAAQAVTLWARWQVVTYTVTYENTQGATNTNATTYTIESDRITLTDITRTGYTFGGWYTALSGGSRVTEIEHGSTGDLTLYARWTATRFTITYDNLNGAPNGNATTYTVESHIIFAAPGAREGYIFGGWKLSDAEGDDIAGTNGLAHNITVWAVWNAIEYTVSYELAGGENADGNPAAYTVESEAIVLAAPTRTGYTFAGWTYEGVSEPVTEVTIAAGSTGDKTFTAHWTAETYIVTLNYNYGDPAQTAQVTVTYDSTYGAGIGWVDDPTRTGYTFAGWYTNAENGTRVTGETAVAITAEQTLYAHWTANEYTGACGNDLYGRERRHAGDRTFPHGLHL